MYVYFLALRYTLSRPINLLGVLGMALGVWALVLVPGIFDGYTVTIEEHIQATSADLQINNLGPQASFARIETLIGNDENIAGMAPRVTWMALAEPRSGKRAPTWRPGTMETGGRFLHVNGIEPARELSCTALGDWTKAVAAELRVPDVAALQEQGGWILLSTARCRSQALARDTLLNVVTAQTVRAEDEIELNLGEQDLRLAGAYATQHHGFDMAMGFVHIDELRRMLGRDGEDWVNEVAIRLHDRSDEAREATRRRIALRLDSDPVFGRQRVRVLTPETFSRNFIQAVHHQSGIIRWVMFAIMVISGFLVYATLSMMVTEKTHDIGVLAALGATPGGIQAVFVGTGLSVSLAGIGLGILSGWLSAVYLDDFNTWMREAWGIEIFRPEVYNLPRVPYHLASWWLAAVASGALLIGLLSALIPGIRASRQNPLDTLRNG